MHFQDGEEGVGPGGGRGELTVLGAEHPGRRPGLGGGGGPGSARERRLIQPELVGRGCIYHPITVTNPGSTT